jgi:hypothetical protein
VTSNEEIAGEAAIIPRVRHFGATFCMRCDACATTNEPISRQICRKGSQLFRHADFD